jgi:uncharacterized MnhB-related membrane protein
VTALQATAIALAGAAALAVVLTRDLVRLTMMASVYSLLLVVLFVIFQAPDVALSALVVGGVAYPVVLLVAIMLDRAE